MAKKSEEATEVLERKTVASEKLKALQLTLDKLEKTYGKGTIMKMGDTVVEPMDSISTGSLGLNIALGMITGLYLHSLLEGLPIYQSGIVDSHVHTVLSTQQSLIFGITLHNIPIAIAFVSLLLEHKSSKLKAVLLLIGFALMAPLGCLISYLLNIFGVENIDGFVKLSFAVVIGIFLHISTAIMFETSENHKYNIAKIASMIAGVLLAAFIS